MKKVKPKKIKKWINSGDPMIWLTAAAVTTSIIIVGGLLILIAVRGLGHFWPSQVAQLEYQDPASKQFKRVIGEFIQTESVSTIRLKDAGISLETEEDFVERSLVKTGNRDHLGIDFTWLIHTNIKNKHFPSGIIALERREWGNFYGYLKAVKEKDKTVSSGDNVWDEMEKRLERAAELFEQIRHIETDEIGSINYGIEKIRLKRRSYELNKEDDLEKFKALETDKQALQEQYEELQKKLNSLYQQINRDSLVAEIMDGREVEVPFAKIVRAYAPNDMGTFARIGMYFSKLHEFIFDEPREANTEGGVFPAIFGTVMMVLIMSVMVTPFGVVAAVYLREYAKQGPLTRTIRIAVNNLAGVPSIVYGVFGLGFFVYFLGGNLDRLFYPEALPAPTFGTPGIMWSSLTLAILTVPVVIVATEEGLSRIPRSLREGSLALGATKAETLWRVILPMSTPAMMTGMILAVARAAGEVAPLMLVGVVKLAPSLAVDGNFPFLHLERKFMHLGFHIYDVGFQSPNVEAARPLVYATALLLVCVIVALNIFAIYIRNRLRENYRNLET